MQFRNECFRAARIVDRDMGIDCKQILSCFRREFDAA